MNVSQSPLEAKVSKLIRKAGGKLPLANLLCLYKKEYNCTLDKPSNTKLSTWVTMEFDSFKLEQDRKKNQIHMLEKTCSMTDTKDIDSESKSKKIEKRILTLLQGCQGRLPLNLVGKEYKTRFNEDLLVPVGIKLGRWFEQFPGIIVEHNTQNNQTFIVMRSDGLHTSTDTSSDEGHKILTLLKENDGCVGMSALVGLYLKKYGKDLLVPVGKKLSHWLCSFNFIVLTQKPSNNEVYISMKHPAQRKFEEKKIQITGIHKEKKSIEIRDSTSSRNENRAENQFSDDSEKELKKKSSLPSPQRECSHSSLSSVVKEENHNHPEKHSDPLTIPHYTASPFVSMTNTMCSGNTSLESALPKEESHTDMSIDECIGQDVHDVKRSDTSTSSFTATAKPENNTSDEISLSCDNHSISSLDGEKCVDTIISVGNNNNEQNMEDEDSFSQLSLPTSVRTACTSTEDYWQLLGEDQREAIIAEATRFLSNSLLNESNIEDMMRKDAK